MEFHQSYFDKNTCYQIFLSTEDEEIYCNISEWAKDHGINVIDNPSNIRFLFSSENADYLNIMSQRNIDFCDKQKNYLLSMMLLTKCNALISGKTSSSRFLPLMHEYDFISFFELGQYE